MPDYQTFALGLDISRYQKVDWDVVAPHIDFVWAKCGEGTDWIDPAFADHCQQAYDRDIPFGAYFYFLADYYTQFPYSDKSRWPTPDRDLQLQNLIHSLKHKKFYFLAIDIEETGNLNIDPDWISEGAKVFAGRVQDWLAANHPGVPLFIYTRNTYIKEHAPNINNWIQHYNSWIAQWWWNPGAHPITWQDLRAKYLPAPNGKPAHFSTRPTWEMWQFTGDRFILPGIYNAENKPRPVDVNLFNGTKAQLHAFINFTPRGTQPPAPPPPPPDDEDDDKDDVKDFVTRAEFDALVRQYAAMEQEINKIREQAVTNVTIVTQYGLKD